MNPEQAQRFRESRVWQEGSLPFVSLGIPIWLGIRIIVLRSVELAGAGWVLPANRLLQLDMICCCFRLLCL